jgi:hypothetical protein
MKKLEVKKFIHMKLLITITLLFTVEVTLAQWTTGININNTNTGQVLIGTTTANTDAKAKLTIYNPSDRTTLVVGNPLTSTGGFTSIQLGTSANMGGYGFIEAVKSSGSANGNLMLNRNGSSVSVGGIYLNSTYKLAVFGKIAAYDEVKVFVNGSTFPDYVFDPNYKLPSLVELEKYIKENRHLPEVPSAAEVTNEGMSLNGMTELLLKKVEELTLYLIEMKKENEALKERLEKLETK